MLCARCGGAYVASSVAIYIFPPKSTSDPPSLVLKRSKKQNISKHAIVTSAETVRKKKTLTTVLIMKGGAAHSAMTHIKKCKRFGYISSFQVQRRALIYLISAKVS